MKRCSFIICFALIIVLAMPMTVDAADFEPSMVLWENYQKAYSCHLKLAIAESGLADETAFFAEYPYVYFSFNWDRKSSSYEPYYMIRTYFSKINFGDDFRKVYFEESDYFYLFLTEEAASLVADNVICAYYWDDYMNGISNASYSSIIDVTDIWLARRIDQPDDYTWGSNVDIGTSEDGVLVPASLFGDFFHDPRIPGVLELEMKAILQTMEVDPLTEVVKILPIGLVCLVGWIALRKGLSLLRQVLFPA